MEGKDQLVVAMWEAWRRGSLARSLAAAWLVAMAVLPWSGGAQPASPAVAGPLTVAASTPVFADLVAQVGGDRTEVWSVVPAGADPHTWEASPREIVRLQESDAFIYMGAYLEPFIEAGAWRRAAQEAAIPQLELAQEIELIAVDRVIDHGDHVHDLRGGDPHVWLDPLKTVEVVNAVAAFLTALDPDGTAQYAANAAAYTGELLAVDAAYTELVTRIPEDRRKLVVTHDAYTYFAARYGFEIAGIVLPNPDGEPSAREFADLLDVVARVGVTVIFAEPQFNAGTIEQLAAEAGVEVGILMTDTFTDEADTYLELMRFNLASLEEHLAE